VKRRLRFLNTRSLSVADAYGESTNQVVLYFLTRQGVKVRVSRDLLLTSARCGGRRRRPPEAAELLDSSWSIAPESNGLYLPCTGINSLDALEALRESAPASLADSVQAGYWFVDWRHPRA